MELIETQCPICKCSCVDTNNYMLQCGHEFHTGCIVAWFRDFSSYCYCCPSPLNSFQSANQASKPVPSFRYASIQARREDAPLKLKQLYKNYKKQMELYDKSKVAYKSFKESELATYRVLRKKFYSVCKKPRLIRRRVNRLKRRICQMFDFDC